MCRPEEFLLKKILVEAFSVYPCSISVSRIILLKLVLRLGHMIVIFNAVCQLATKKVNREVQQEVGSCSRSFFAYIWSFFFTYIWSFFSSV